MKQMRKLEKKKARLKKVVAEQAVDISILKEVNRENSERARQEDERPLLT